VHVYSLINSSRESIGGLAGGSDSLGLSSFGLILIEFHKLGKIELWLLKNLDLSNDNVLEREDLGAVLSDLLVDLVTEELLEEFLEGWFSGLGNKNFHHLLAELLSLGSLSVASSLDLVLVASGEGNSENSHEVAVVSLGLNESLNEGVPFLDKRAELVTGDVHTVEVGVAVETFDFLDLDLNLSPRGLVSLVVELTKRDGEDTTTKGVSGDL